MKHTKGPWYIQYGFNVFGEGNRLVASAGGYSTNADSGEHVLENEANARLIAAAPALLEACKLALNAFEKAWAINWDDLARAIAKAEAEEG